MKGTDKASVEDEALAMLKLFTDLGLLMHHEEQSLQDLVILDPANYLITPASRIMCDKIHENSFIKEARRKEGQLFKLLRDGILDPHLLPILWKDRPEDIEILQILLVKFGFLVPIIVEQLNEAGADSERHRYLVPALLPSHALNSRAQTEADGLFDICS